MIDIKDYILLFAKGKEHFLRADLLMQSSEDKLSLTAVDSALSRLVQHGTLMRVRSGVYALPQGKVIFPIVIGEVEQRVGEWMKQQFPLMPFGIYNGQTFAPLQHHLSYNTITYVEVDSWDTQTVFDRMRMSNLELPIYLCPDSDFIYNYVDMGQEGIIVKRLVTEAPMQKKGVWRVPMLEKLLVDIRTDADLSYLSGSEATRMLENARALFMINESRLHRYAKRRGVVL